MVSRTQAGIGIASSAVPASRSGPTVADRRSKSDQVGGGNKSVATRETLLASAAKLFADRGYAATPVTDIAGDAGTSVGLLYYHFTNKLGVYGTLYEEYQARQEARAHHVAAEAKSQGIDGSARLLRVLRSYLEGVLAERGLGRVWYMHDTPSGFEEIRERASGHWTKRNFRLAGAWGEDGRAIVMFINASLVVLPREIVAARTDREGQQLIDSAVRVYSRLLVDQ